MRRVTSLLLLMLMLSFTWVVNAQVSSYTFQSSSGTYTPITGGTVHLTGAWDDAQVSNVALGFNFMFNGVEYSTISINPNGYLIIGGGSTTMSYTPISNTTAVPGSVSAIGRDLQGITGTGEVRSELTGTAGDYVFVVQWTDAKRYGTSYPDENLDFQIKLYENGGIAQFVYGPMTGSAYATPVHPQVGMRGATNADYTNRTTTTNWGATTAGIINTATCTLTNLVYPANGTTFTFTPPDPNTPLPPTAPVPANASIEVPVDGSLSWTFGTNSVTYDLMFGLAGNMTEVVTGATAGATGTYDYTGLTNSVLYQWRVIEHNGDLMTTGPVWSFYTECVPFSIPFAQNFNGVTTPALPICWSKIVGNTTNTFVNVETTTLYPNSAPYCAKMYNSSADTANLFLILPMIGDPLAGNRVTFFAKGGTNYSLLVGTMSDPTDPATFTQVGEVFPPGVQTPFQVSFADYTGTDSYVAFKHGNMGTSQTIYIDDVVVEVLPDCVEPGTLTVANITNNSAELGWTSQGEETMWDVAYGAPGFDPATEGTIVPASTNPYTLGDLTSATPYEFYVRADCGADAVSVWAGPKGFTTACDVFELPYYEDFTGGVAGTFPGCWSQAGLSSTNWSLNATANALGVAPELRFNYSPSFTGEAFMVSPMINTTGETTVAISFKHFFDYYAVPFTFGMKTTSDGINWNTVWEVVDPTANVGPEALNIVVDNTDVGSATFQFAFWLSGYTFNMDNWYIDDISVSVPSFGSLAGYVTEATRGAVNNAHVFAGDYEAYTDETGYYLIEGMFPGTYNVTCEAEGYFPVTVDGVEVIANQTATQDFELGYAQIAVNPSSLEATLQPEGTTTQTLTISNPAGTEPLNWSTSLEELSPVRQVVSLPAIQKINGTNNQSELSAGIAPSTNSKTVKGGDFDVMRGSSGYGFDMYPGQDYINFDTDTPGAYTVSVPTTHTVFAADFDQNNVFYAIDNDLAQLFTVDITTGAFTLVGSTLALTDLAFDRTTNTMYGVGYDGVSTSKLYTLDLATGATTLIGNCGTMLVISIACDGNGDLYGFNISTDVLVSIDKLTGAATEIGPVGFDGNYAQDMSWDPNSNIIYMSAYNNTAGQGQLRVVDVNTGSTALVGAFPGGAEVCGLGFMGASFSWLAIEPTSGTINSGESQDVTVTFDAAGLIDSTYLANINITHNGMEVSDGTLSVPATLIVASPDPPGLPTDPSPAAGATLVSLQPDFSWTNGAGTAQVRFVLTKGTGPFAEVIYSSPWFIGNSVSLADVGKTLVKKTNYSWKVYAKNAAGTTPGTSWSFTTIGAGSISGIITDNYSGNPLEGASITAGDGAYSALSLADGTYTIANVLEGPYTVVAELDGYVSQEQMVTVVHNQIALASFALDLYLDPPFGLSAVIENFVDVRLTWQPPMIFSNRNLTFTPQSGTRPKPTASQEALDVSNIPGTATNSVSSPSLKITDSRAMLYDNINIVNSTCAATSAIESQIIAPSTLYGSNCNNALSYSVADVFSVPSGQTWQIDNMEIFNYQTGSTTTSTITGAYVRIWNGSPLEGGEVVWGDMTTNIMASTEFSGVYRVSASCETGRPIMKTVATTAGLILTPGTYYVETASTGSLTSGPWYPLVSVGAAGTALQYTSTGWVLIDNTTPIGNYHKIPFVFNGIVVGGALPENLLGFNIYRNDELLEYVPLERSIEYLDEGLLAGDYYYTVGAVYIQGESELEGPAAVSVLAPPVLVSADADYFGVQLAWTEGSSVPLDKSFAKAATSNVKMDMKKKERNTSSVNPYIYPNGGRAIGDSCENPATAVEGLNSAPAQPYWYEFTLTEDMEVTISSCVDSQVVDTDLEVYDACGGNLVAYNDDLLSACGSYIYSSGVTFNGTAGVTYKIAWLDTYEVGAFDFNIILNPVCVVECPAGALIEDEACGEDLNGGCNADIPAYIPISNGDVYCGTAYADNGRDTDWYELVLDAPKTVTWTATAEFPVLIFIIDGNAGCEGLSILTSATAMPCETASVSATVPPGTYWLWVGNQTFAGNPCGAFNNYVAEVNCEDAFLTYFNVFKDGIDIADVYGKEYYDQDVTNGETYCYTVSQVVDPAFETAVSNELCASVPLIPAIEVNPLSLFETHLTPPAQITTKVVTVTNTGAGVLDWNLAVNLTAPVRDIYCDASTTTEDEIITNVLCGDIDNNSLWQGLVADYTAISTTIIAGESEPIFVTNGGGAYSGDMVTCWVDWNLDLEFGAGDEEFILTGDGTGVNFAGAITVPEGTADGAYRMRVRIMWNVAPVPCGSATYGEVEDYTIMVGAPAAVWLSADILSGTLASGASADVTVTFNSEGLDTGTYSGGLVFTSNDPFAPIANVSAELAVTANMGTLAGYVNDALTRGPVSGVTITADELRGTFTAVTDVDGYYEMLIPVGSYSVTAEKIGYDTQTIDQVVVEFELTTAQDFMLEFSAPVLLTADGNYFDVTTTWQGNPIFDMMADNAHSGISTSDIEVDLRSVTRAEKEKSLWGPDKQINKTPKITRGPGETCAEAVTATDGVNSCAGAPYWYEYTPTTDVIVNISSCVSGQEVDTKLYVYDACEGTQVAYNDDLYTSCDYFDYASAVSFPATAGTSYKIYWDPYWESTPFDFFVETEAIAAGLTCETAVTAVEGLNSAPQQPYWYEFTPTEDKEITISSCIDGQSVDTYLYVYDACGGSVVAYNDDLLSACGAYTYASGVSFNATAGVSYKIYWDNYYGTSAFDFTIELNDLCAVVCPEGAIVDGEPCPEDEYVDTYNGGCNSDPAVFTQVNCGDVICGTASNYVFAGTNRRDTDWYELVIDQPKVVTFAVTAEFPVIMGLLVQVEPGVPGCGNLTGYIAPYALANPCQEASVELTLIPGTYYFFVSINGFTGYPCGTANNYVASWSCTDTFITYYNLYRDGDKIATTYGNSFVDTDVAAGDSYCYTVDQAFTAGLMSGMSNELCATVPFAPEIAVNPAELFESLQIGETSSQNLTVSNSGLGDLDFDVDVILHNGVGNTLVLLDDGMETYLAGDHLASQAVAQGNTYWTTWSNLPGSTEDPMVSSTQAFEGVNSFVVEGANDCVLLLGDLTSGEYNFEFDMYVPTGFFGYFNVLQNFAGNDSEFGLQVYFDALGQGLVDAGVASAATFAYNYDEWTSVKVHVNLDTDWAEFYVNGSLVIGYQWTLGTFGTPGPNQLSAVDFYAWAENGTPKFYIDNVTLTSLVVEPWLVVSPMSGTVAPGKTSIDLTADFNATALEAGTYTADIIINSNDPFNPEVVVPVQLMVGALTHNIVMPQGWSAWSSYINPGAGMGMEAFMAPVVENMVVTQYFNQLYYPAYGINNMSNFTNNHGYLSKMDIESTLPVEGFVADPTVMLTSGWNLMPVLQECSIPAADVFGNLPGLVIAWDPTGNGIYYPAYSIYTLTNLMPGKAYWVKVDADVEYVYPGCAKSSGNVYSPSLRAVNNTAWNDVNYTAVNHAMVFDANAVAGLQAGDMIGAFTSEGICAGLVEFKGDKFGFNLFGDDITTEFADGFVDGEHISFRLFRPATDEEFDIAVTYSYTAPNADGLFAINGVSVITDLKLSPTSIGVNQLNDLTIYPNPSSGIFNIAIGNVDGDITFVVMNAQGQEVYKGNLLESQVLDLSAEPKGVYFIKFMNSGVLGIEKLVIK